MYCAVVCKCKTSYSPKGEWEGLNIELSTDIIPLLKLRRVTDLFLWGTLPIGEISGDEISLEPGSGVSQVRPTITAADGQIIWTNKK